MTSLFFFSFVIQNGLRACEQGMNHDSYRGLIPIFKSDPRSGSQMRRGVSERRCVGQRIVKEVACQRF
jgi:hypothetical protein